MAQKQNEIKALSFSPVPKILKHVLVAIDFSGPPAYERNRGNGTMN
jgi:hypothetical protein